MAKKIEQIDKQLSKLSLPRGEGSISWHNKDKCVLVYKKTIHFKDKSERVTVYGNDIPELYKKMKALEDKKVEKNKDQNTVEGTETFGEEINKWFITFRMVNNKERTVDREECTLNNQILKYTDLSQLQIAVVSDKILTEHLNTLMKKYSWSTVKKTYELLDGFFKYYYIRNLNYNPMNTVVKPRQAAVLRMSSYQPKDIAFLNPNEIKLFNAEASKKYSNGKPRYKFGDGLVTMMYTGVRFGEANALRWCDIDFKNKYMNIETGRSIIKNRNKKLKTEPNYKYIISTPKTKSSVREVYLVEQAIESLQRLKDIQNPLNEEEYIFSVNHGEPVTYSNLKRTFELICRNAKITREDENIGLHSLRHTFISLLCRNKVDKMIIAKIVGQSDTKMISKIYYHIMQVEKDQGIKTLERNSFNITLSE